MVVVTTVKTGYRVIVSLDHCKACYYCSHVCPQDVFEISAEINRGGYFPIRVVREDQCTGCLLCYFVCPDFAISVESDQ